MLDRTNTVQTPFHCSLRQTYSVTELPDVSAMRISYDRDKLHEDDLASTPLEQFNRWLHDAVAVGTDALIEPNAMVLSTISSSSLISSRSVLLKAIDPRGLTFYTNYGSRKADEIEHHPQVSVVFPWYPLHRQVVVQGTVTKVSREESFAYFQTRPHLSQLGAICSAQSTEIESREVIENRMAELIAEFPEGTEVPMPDFWGGYLITVDTMEFWQGRRSRLHDRLRFINTGASQLLDDPQAWRVSRFSP